MSMIRITFTLPEELLAQIDEERQMVSRSAWITALLRGNVDNGGLGRKYIEKMAAPMVLTAEDEEKVKELIAKPTPPPEKPKPVPTPPREQVQPRFKK